MKYGIYFQRSFWLVVPEFLYLILLCGGWIAVVISVGMTIASIIRKKEKKHIIKWVIILLISLAIAVMAMTGKIVLWSSFFVTFLTHKTIFFYTFISNSYSFHFLYFTMLYLF